jgi:hypothetical protein
MAGKGVTKKIEAGRTFLPAKMIAGTQLAF